MRRWTFSRSAISGPCSRRTSASMRTGRVAPPGMSIGRSAIRSNSAPDAGSNLTVRSNAVPRSKIRPTVAPARPVSRASATSPDGGHTGHCRSVEDEPDEGDVHLLLEREVDHSRHGSDGGANPFTKTSQRADRLQRLHGDVRARARQHVVDSMRDRLSNSSRSSPGAGKFLPQLRQQGFARPIGRPQADVDLCGFHALDMLVVLGAASAPRGRDDFRL